MGGRLFIPDSRRSSSLGDHWRYWPSVSGFLFNQSLFHRVLTKYPVSQQFLLTQAFAVSQMVEIIISGQVMTQKHWWRSVSFQYNQSFHKTYISMSGLSCRNCGLFTIIHGPVHGNFHGRMLYSPPQCNHWSSTWTFSILCREVSHFTEYLHRCRSPSINISSTSACSPPLFLFNPPVWLPEWTLLVNHRV